MTPKKVFYKLDDIETDLPECFPSVYIYKELCNLKNKTCNPTFKMGEIFEQVPYTK